MWRVLRVYIAQTNRVMYVHIVDRCAQDNSECWKNYQPYNFLIDIHQAGWGAAGTSDIYSSGKFSYLFRLTSDDMIQKYGKYNYMNDWLNCACDYANCYPDQLGSSPWWCPRGKCYLKDSCY